MAEITKVAPIPTVITGYEIVDYGLARDDINAGDLVVIDSVAAPANNRYNCAVKKATGSTADGVWLKSVKDGGTCEFGSHIEMDGFADLTPGTRLYVVSGKIDDEAPEVTVGDGESSTIDLVIVPHQMVAVNSKRIRFNFV